MKVRAWQRGAVTRSALRRCTLNFQDFPQSKILSSVSIHKPRIGNTPFLTPELINAGEVLKYFRSIYGPCFLHTEAVCFPWDLTLWEHTKALITCKPSTSPKLRTSLQTPGHLAGLEHHEVKQSHWSLPHALSDDSRAIQLFQNVQQWGGWKYLAFFCLWDTVTKVRWCTSFT